MAANLKRFLPAIIPLAVLLIGLVVSVVVLSTKTRWQNRATGAVLSVSSSAVLSLSAPATVNVGSPLDLTITETLPADGSLKVTSTKIVITYPTSLTFVSATPGPFFTQSYQAATMKMLSIVDTATPGKIVINYGAPCTTASPWQCYPRSTTGTVATIRFQAPNTATTATFTFDSANTLATAIDATNTPITTSVLDTTQLASVITTIGTASVYPTAGLISRWKMDETSGQTVNDSAGPNTGTATGTTIITGKLGQARNFNGTSDFINFANESSFDFEYNQPFSLSAWVKTTRTGVYQNIFSKALNSTSPPGYLFRIEAFSGGIGLSIVRAYRNYLWGSESSKIVTDGAWHHVAATYDGSALVLGIKLYVDGQSQTVTDYSLGTIGTILNNASPFIGGIRPGTTDAYYLGTIDDVAVWNRALSAQEITNLYKSF